MDGTSLALRTDAVLSPLKKLRKFHNGSITASKSVSLRDQLICAMVGWRSKFALQRQLKRSESLPRRIAGI
jgi:hypothetical protein